MNRTCCLGLTGTGSELFAGRARAEPPARAPWCVSIVPRPQTLVESELFGHEKGAHRRRGGGSCFEPADGGTIFLTRRRPRRTFR